MSTHPRTSCTSALAGPRPETAGTNPLRRAGHAAGTAVAAVALMAVVAGCGPLDDSSPTSAAPPAQREAAAEGPAPAVGSGAERPVYYQLGIVREGDVVVVVESLDWNDWTELTLDSALHRAVPAHRGRCGHVVRPCARPRAGDGRASFPLAPDPVLTDGDWRRITGGAPSPVRSATRPSRLVDCISLTPWSGASEFRAAAYLDPTRPSGDLSEFVLRFEDAAPAAEAVRRIRNQFDDCPSRTDSGQVEVTEHEHHASDGRSPWPVDEAFVGVRAYAGRPEA
jgi:hypothetical protein